MNSIQQQRQHWMSVLARAPSDLLYRLSDEAIKEIGFEIIRAPEIGLTQVRARMGNQGDRFNLGDMTLTRCVVRSEMDTLGYSYIAGRNQQHALRAAQLDALLQTPCMGEALQERVIKPIEAALEQARSAKQQETDETRVDFFTLVRGED
ncbi:phosphonate C-P lyase system protein PhnG [Marinobacterium sediminicola]|uniref:Alpha-D-ribose 1-methylphosphonate 5-triphosphate synthase subunit PhnG n=1 Tax=Marinobacterium sediminicola TaxID=518898 RepID=A0ABY1RYH6_9GAMM|nr:phosphonate C-P lyase system protein PhnG [Marinobacterium sediminicola]ULG68111.1 phosphonate C-P lyase system protein PhnG [Marinobacterium sediminicola]SMR73376.1 alpha-D-ribose 1-methylphosphonate 5-triphosphate synthase subunit PhnG [Marinobacterium sediminicola]